MNVKQISVLLDNTPGKLYEITTVLTSHNIGIRAITVANSTDTSTVRFIVDNVIWTSSVLKGAGFVVSVADVVAIEAPNVPGSMNKVLELFRDNNVNIEYMYHVAGKYSINSGHICIVFKFTDNEAAIEALNAAGIRMLGHGELAVM